MSGARRAGLRQTLDRHHASENTRLHALYMFYFLGFKQVRVEQYEKTGTISRQNTEKSGSMELKKESG